MKRTINLFLLSISVFPMVTFGQDIKHPVSPIAIIKQSAQMYMSEQVSVGMSIGVYVDGKTYTNHFGELHRGKHDLPTDRTMYYIASITKTFTGTLLAKAVIEHKIRLDDDIRDYLDGDYPNLEYQGHFITVAQLLNHRSGLPYLMPFDPVYNTNNNEEITNFLNRLYTHYTKADFYKDLHKVTLDTIPGLKFRYSSTGAQLCGYILEKLYGMGYDQLLKKQLTESLGMPSTKIMVSAKEASHIAPGYDENGKIMPALPNEIEGAGSLKSTITDMLKYARWHLDESNPAAKLSHQPTWKNWNYWAGLNWQVIESADKKRVIWQSGNVAGFTSYCVIYPEDQMAIIVLTNEESHSAPAVIEKMINSLSAKLKPGAPALPN